MDGFFLLDKSPSMTSFQSGHVLRRLLGVKKVGHTGTLDPMATGVLPILCGNATRALDLLPNHDKRYTASFQFGMESTTEDQWGEVTHTHRPLPSRAAVEAALPAFLGEISQVPPMMSAVQKDGVRLYELARQGLEVKRDARRVTVYRLDLLDFDEENGILTLDCACSKGTYIRTIGADLGRMLGCGAVMTALRRTEACGFSIADCVTLDEVRGMTPEERALRLQPTDRLFAALPSVTVTAAQATRFANGGALSLDRLPTAVTATVRVYGTNGRFLGLGNPVSGELQVLKIFPSSEL